MPCARKWIIMMTCILLVSLILTGCWERRELNELAFVMGMGIDKEGDKYKVSMQVVVPSEMTNQPGNYTTPVTEYISTVESIYHSISMFTLRGPRLCYMGHIRILVIGEEVAREGIAPILDVMKRSSGIRPDFYILVARDASAAEVLNILTKQDKIPANKLFHSLDEASTKTGKTTKVTLDELIEALVSNGKDAVLTGVSLKGDVRRGGEKSNVQSMMPKARLNLQDVAVFRKDQLVEWLDENEAVGYSFIMNQIKRTTRSIRGPDGKRITVGPVSSHTERNVKIINGVPHIFLHLKGTFNIQSSQSDMDLGTDEAIRYVTRKTEEELQALMQQTIDRMSEGKQLDIFGFGESIYKSSPSVWYQMIANYGHRYLVHIPVHYKIEVLFNRIGTLDTPFYNEVKS